MNSYISRVSLSHGSLQRCSWKTWTRNDGRAHPVKMMKLSLAVPYTCTVCIYMYTLYMQKTFKINKYKMYLENKYLYINYMLGFLLFFFGGVGGRSSKEKIHKIKMITRNMSNW